MFLIRTRNTEKNDKKSYGSETLILTNRLEFLNNFTVTCHFIIKSDEHYFRFPDLWADISPILWEVLDHLEDLLDDSPLEFLMQGAVEHPARSSPWHGFLRHLLAGDISETRLLAVVARLQDLRRESSFYEAGPRILEATRSLGVEPSQDGS